MLLEADIAEELEDSLSALYEFPTSTEEVSQYVQKLWTMLEEFAVTYGGKLIIALLLLIIGFKIINFLTKKLVSSKAMGKLDPSAAVFIKNIISISTKILIGIVALSILGVPMTSIITVVGSCGLAVGLALQGSLTNIAGGFVLLLVKPFKVGDFIIEGDISGTVTEIGIFNTKVQTIDNKIVIIPNSTISNATVTNVTALDLRRVDLTFTAAYSDDVKTVENTLLSVCDRNELILKDPAPFARVSGHKDSALEYTVRAWCKTDDYWSVYFDLYRDVKYAFDEKGITIPFPQLDVHEKK
ncbi:MAG: mechanosensitive ion channel family protein [Oscillospiraceae bacterium]|nr:mechanosensitive ion channel family protein [Oscillospiraceae bacterium]